jgi:hypothetical protein
MSRYATFNPYDTCGSSNDDHWEKKVLKVMGIAKGASFHWNRLIGELTMNVRLTDGRSLRAVFEARKRVSIKKNIIARKGDSLKVLSLEELSGHLRGKEITSVIADRAKLDESRNDYLTFHTSDGERIFIEAERGSIISAEIIDGSGGPSGAGVKPFYKYPRPRDPDDGEACVIELDAPKKKLKQKMKLGF